jgi:hypothetical protein
MARDGSATTYTGEKSTVNVQSRVGKQIGTNEGLDEDTQKQQAILAAKARKARELCNR